MLRVTLMTLPFAAYHYPSIGLTQLKAVVDSELGGEVETEIVYANHDLANYMGVEVYRSIGASGQHLQSGFAEWFFRQAAFPELADNTEEYFTRYYPFNDPETQAFRKVILEKRPGLDAVLDRIIDRYHLDRSNVVGFTSMFFENMVSFALARKLKERNPDIVTIMGGANCEAPAGYELVRNAPQMDFTFSGCSLRSLPEFLRNLLLGAPEKNHRINGVFSRQNSGGPENAGQPPAIGHMGAELDINHPIPLDYDAFLAALDTNFPDYEIKAVLPFETSRGCWWGEHAHCTFCGLNKGTMGYRAMRSDLALELIRSLFKYADRASVLMCVDNILQRQYVKDVFPLLETPESTAIFYQLKANLSEKEVAAMSKARVLTITPGFESLANTTLKLMNKGVTSFQNIQVMKYCLMHDVHPGWNLLVGSPGEPQEVYEKYVRDLPDLVHLPPPQAIFSIHFNRFSPYFDKAKEFGLDLEPIDYYEMVYPWGRESIANIAYDFQDMNFDADYVLALSDWIDRIQERIRHWRTTWDEAVPPKLHFKETAAGTSIHDSRSGRSVEYPITPVTRALLEHLGEPRRVANLPAELANLPGFDAEHEVAFADEHHLVWRDGERIMSLVVPRDTKPMTFRSSGLGGEQKLKDRTPELVGAISPIARTARRVQRPGA
ncbi:MAG: RiPP maturation radical SAM C-methyltransferase [Acidobacteriota bacterium]|nr:RiPP maturation radical SAM C-methyltransferase [Acidobacteriota bacterium]